MAENQDILSMEQRLLWLAEIVRNEGNSTADKLKAIDMMNKMQRFYEVSAAQDGPGRKLEELL